MARGMIGKRRLAAALAVLCAGLGASAASAEAFVTITAVNADHAWTSDPATIAGRVTGPDGQPLAAAALTVEARGYPYTAAFAVVGTVTTDADGRFTYSATPVKNLQVRIRDTTGAISKVVSLRVFQFSLEGKLKPLSDGRQRVTELTSVPAGYRIARAYLYFCKPKAKRCDYMARGRAHISGQQMTTRATFTPPYRYRLKHYTVVFRYVPRPGWGDSNALERRRPKLSIAAE
ncbi:MAG TPA: carboxypeptidase-like regulatory domain-containing protein [Baekduia sp.]|nr:carboxypeptidase-like regulatory domain-containing protein [Baekduia sp.]